MIYLFGGQSDPLIDQVIKRFVSGLIGYDVDDNSTSLGLFEDGYVTTGVVFSGWDKLAGTIEVTIASSRKTWATRNLMRLMAAYVFGDLKCQMAVFRTPASITRVPGAIKACGGDVYRVKRLFGREQDGFLSTLTAEQWQASKFNMEHTDGSA